MTLRINLWRAKAATCFQAFVAFFSGIRRSVKIGLAGVRNLTNRLASPG